MILNTKQYFFLVDKWFEGKNAFSFSCYMPAFCCIAILKMMIQIYRNKMQKAYLHLQCYKKLLLIHVGFTLVYFTFHYIGFAKITLFQTSVYTGLDEVLKKYHPKCLSVRDAVTCKSYSGTQQSESILKLPRILCF